MAKAKTEVAVVAEKKEPRAFRKRTDQEIIDALRECRGMVAVAARMLGVSRESIYHRLKTSPEIKEAHVEISEHQLDRSELKLFEAVEAGEAWAVCFYLKCKGKERGYIERSQVEHSGTVELDVRAIRERVESRLDGISQRLLEKPRQE